MPESHWDTSGHTHKRWNGAQPYTPVLWTPSGITTNCDYFLSRINVGIASHWSSNSNSYQSLGTIAMVQDFSGNSHHTLGNGEIASSILLSIPSSPLLLQIVLHVEPQMYCMSLPQHPGQAQEPTSRVLSPGSLPPRSS
ncbi:hypothetical protein STEG23_013789 [Scotinomys teguina]